MLAPTLILTGVITNYKVKCTVFKYLLQKIAKSLDKTLENKHNHAQAVSFMLFGKSRVDTQNMILHRYVGKYYSNTVLQCYSDH